MSIVTVYLLKIILLSGSLYSYYRIFLADRHFHRFNRLFLLGIPLLALALPFIHLPFGGYFWRTGQTIPSLPGITSATPQDGQWHETDAITPGPLPATADCSTAPTT